MSLPSGMEGARRHRWGSGGLVLPLDFCAQFPASEDSRRFEKSGRRASGAEDPARGRRRGPGGPLYPAIRRREDERTRGSADASTAGLPARRRTLLDLPGRLSIATLAHEAIKGPGADRDQATADAKEGTRWQRSR